MQIETIKYNLPEFWASALINADTSGMEEEELNQFNQWIENRKREIGTVLN